MASATENRFINLYINGRQAGSTLAEIRRRYQQLTAEINRGELSQKEYNQKVAELRQYGRVLDDHRNKVRGISKSWEQWKAVAIGVVGGNLILTAFQKITQFIPQLINSNAELADSFADVAKTTGLSAEGVEELNSRLKAIDTRTPRARLLELARDAGKLGITGVENIASFVKAADQIEVALGEDLGEGAVTTLGKLNNLFGTSDIFGYEQGLLKLGSVINELGANSEATEGAIVDFTSRLAGVATQAGISFENLAAYGATLDSLGQQTETSATAISQALVNMFKDTPTFARIAGKSVEEFTEILNTDANEAFILFLDGLNGNNEGLGALTQKFDELGIDGSRAIQVLGALAGNTATLRDQQILSNRAFTEGISLTAEFAKKNENAAANLEKIGRFLNGLWVNSALKSAIEGITGSLADMVKVPVSQTLEGQRIRFNALMTAIQDTNTTEEQRKIILDQLQESYGQRLGNLNLEKASYDELAKAQARVNQQYIIEIALQQQKERIQELAEKSGERLNAAANKAIDANEQLAATNKKLGTNYKTVDEAIKALSKTALSQYDVDFKRVVLMNEEAQELQKLAQARGSASNATGRYNSTTKELNTEQQRQVQLVEQLKKDYPELAAIIDQVNAGIQGVATPPGAAPSAAPSGSTTTSTGTTTAVTAEPDRYQLALDAIKRATEEEYLYLEQYRLETKIAEDIFNEEMLTIKISGLMMQQAAAEEFGEDRLAIQRDLAQAEIELMERVNRARERSTDVVLDAVETQKAGFNNLTEAEVESAIASGFNASAQANNANAAARAVLTAIRSIIQAKIAEAVAGALAAEFTKLGIFGAITGAAAGALAGILFSTLIPPLKDPERPSFALGTENYGGSFIAGDQGREIVNGAQVIPADITQAILAANSFSRPTLQPNFAAINEGLTYTQSQSERRASQQSGQGMDMAPLLAEIRGMRAELSRATDKRVYLVDKDYDEFLDRKNRAGNRVVIRK